MIDAATLADILTAQRAARRSISYIDGGGPVRVRSFAEVYERALGTLHHLRRLGAGRGDSLIIHVSDNEAFVDTFWGAVLGGIVPVPVSAGATAEHRRKLLRIARRLHAPFLVTERRLLDRLAELTVEPSECATLIELSARGTLVEDMHDLSARAQPLAPSPGDPALIQFSSGSTDEPKGVPLTHANIVANWRAATAAAELGEHDVSLSWMPLTHDMGLIGLHIIMLANGIEMHSMATDLFVRRPLLWLEVASRVGASILASPNFGYRHYLNALAERPVDSLDLSRVRIIFNGGEQISFELCEEFLNRLAPAKLARRSMFPVYGLAEASLAVSFPRLGSSIRAVRVDSRHLGVGQRIRLSPPSHAWGLSVVSEGAPIGDCRIRIVGDGETTLGDEHVGHVQISGASVASGYGDDERATAATFTTDGWLRTGDLGFVYDGLLHICGRAKEVILLDGQSFHPHDLERVLHRAGVVDDGRVIVAGARPPGSECDHLVVFVVHRGTPDTFVVVSDSVVAAMASMVGVRVTAVVPIDRVPKTTSGKPRRAALALRYAAGAFDQVLRDVQAARDTRQPRPSPLEDAIELALTGILARALGGRRVARDENLFTLGADSLAIVAVHAAIDDQYPGCIELPEIFDYPTVAELASVIASRSPAPSLVRPGEAALSTPPSSR